MFDQRMDMGCCKWKCFGPWVVIRQYIKWGGSKSLF